jgi:hypothetical protein
VEKIKTFIPLNFELMANPVNWIIITLMVLLAGIAMAHIFSTVPQDTQNNNNIQQ